MKAVLRTLHSPDLSDLQSGAPPDPADFRILVQAMIGPDCEQDSEESFDFLVCTPKWLARNVGVTKCLWGRHHLIVHEYDFALIRQAIQEVCERATGPDWQAAAQIIARFGAWEFEDYSEPQAPGQV